MKQKIHPKDFRPVIFHDTTTNDRFLIMSAVATKQEDTWKDGKTYPLKEIAVSSGSHPFYTGQEKVMDTAGRVERFKARAAAAVKKK